MRISDWSSDVCSSDLQPRERLGEGALILLEALEGLGVGKDVGRDLRLRRPRPRLDHLRSEEHTSELQSLMRISYAVFCLKKKKKNDTINRPLTYTINNRPKQDYTTTSPYHNDNKHIQS